MFSENGASGYTVVHCFLLSSADRVAVPSRPAKGHWSTVNDSAVPMRKRACWHVQTREIMYVEFDA